MLLSPLDDMLAAMQKAGAVVTPPAQDIVLTRQMLLTLHETGHSLGFQHNWNSSMNGRASVMGYPTPRVKVTAKGTIDLSEAYRAEPGEYDRIMVRYAYTEYPAAKEQEGLASIVKEMRAKGLMFTAATDPRWNWYDDLAVPDEYLREAMAARKIILSGYGPSLLASDEVTSDLRNMRLWMGYLHHRWAIDAAMKYLGGQYQNIVLKGDTLKPTEPVPAPLQRSILALLMEAIEPASLAIPDRILESLPASSRGRDQEDMADDYVFDYLAGGADSCRVDSRAVVCRRSRRTPCGARRSRCRCLDLARSHHGGCRRNVGCAARFNPSRTFASAGHATSSSRRAHDAGSARSGHT